MSMHHEYGSKDINDKLSSVGYIIGYYIVRSSLASVATHELLDPCQNPVPQGISMFHM